MATDHILNGWSLLGWTINLSLRFKIKNICIQMVRFVYMKGRKELLNLKAPSAIFEIRSQFINYSLNPIFLLGDLHPIKKNNEFFIMKINLIVKSSAKKE